MKKVICFIIILFIVLAVSITFYMLNNKSKVETSSKETITTTKKSKVEKEVNIMDGITINYHASIRMEKNGIVIYFDPYKITDEVNDADYIFITHSHYDHYSEEDIKKVMKDDTKFVITSDLETNISDLGVSTNNIMVVYPDKNYVIDDIHFDTVSSYNINKTYHKKSYNWVGYVVNINDTKYYVVGDSDATEELKNVKCDVIFIPVGGTYTMTDKEAAYVVNEMSVKYAVPIHYGVVGSRKNAEDFVAQLNDNIKGIIIDQ